MCCVWDSLGRFWGCEFLLCVRVCGWFWRVILCCVLDSLVWVWVIEYVLYVAEIGACLED